MEELIIIFGFLGIAAIAYTTVIITEKDRKTNNA